MVEGGISCIKYCMFGFNFIFVICGIVLIVIGGVAYNSSVTHFLGSSYFTIPALLIVLGVIVFVLAFLGCCGAAKENRCMVTTFGLLLFIIFCIEVGCVIGAYYYQGDIETFVKNNMNTSISQNASDARVFWDDIQSREKCCGVDGPKDYTNIGVDIPPSCCEQSETKCDDKKAFQTGCYHVIVDFVHKNYAIIGGVGIGIAVIEVLGIIFSWCLASAIRKEYEGV